MSLIHFFLTCIKKIKGHYSLVFLNENSLLKRVIIKHRGSSVTLFRGGLPLLWAIDIWFSLSFFLLVCLSLSLPNRISNVWGISQRRYSKGSSKIQTPSSSPSPCFLDSIRGRNRIVLTFGIVCVCLFGDLQVDLLDFIDWSSVECLNQSSTHSLPNALKQVPLSPFPPYCLFILNFIFNPNFRFANCYANCDILLTVFICLIILLTIRVIEKTMVCIWRVTPMTSFCSIFLSHKSLNSIPLLS